MPKDLGLYITLLPDGNIKRDLTGGTGKISLEETTVQDELILYSELNFEPYALVVDAIRNMAGDIVNQDEGHYGEVSMREFQLMVDTVIDLVRTLENETPLYGTLLRTEIEDKISKDDGSAMYPIRTGQELLTILTAVMRFQFTVNELLHDLAGETSLAPAKYHGLWQMSVTERLNLGGELTARYYFRTVTDYYQFLLLHFVAAKTKVAFCQCCGRYFVPRTKGKTIYCDRILKKDKTCKHWGPILKHRLEASQETVIETFDRAKRRMYKRYERTADGKQSPSEKDLSYDDYYVWLDRATEARDSYLKGELSEKDALSIIDAQ